MSKIDFLFKDLKKANQRLKEVGLKRGKSDIRRDATLQRFEFTFELTWKLMQALAKDSGEDVFGPKNAIRFAAKANLIDKPEAWFKYHEFRNQIAHIYQEDMAKKIYQEVKDFYQVVDIFICQTEEYLA